MKIGLSLFIIIFQLNCIGSQDSESPSYLSLAGILQNNKTGENINTTVPYGNQPSGLVPTSTGVPANWKNAPDLQTGYQSNLNTLDLFGKFYHRSNHFPELRQITDISIVKLKAELEQSGQLDWDFNLFVLDAKMGVILFTKGLKELGAFQSSELIGSKKISIHPSGNIAIIDSNNLLNFCLQFNGTNIVKRPNCQGSLITSISVAPLSTNEFISLDNNGQISAFSVNDGQQISIDIRKNLSNPIFLSTNENVLTIIYDSGNSAIVFLDTGVNNNSRFSEIANAKNILFSSTGDESNATPIQINSIIRAYEGRFYAYSPTLHSIIGLDPYLKPYSKNWNFPSVPIPFVRIKEAKGLAMHPNSRLVHAFDGYAIHVFSETSIMEREDLMRYVPEEVQTTLEIFIQSVNLEIFDPKKDIFTYPEVKSYLESVLNSI